MNRFTKGLIATTFLAAATLLTGCATNIKASSSTNPAPVEAFSAFGRIEVKPAMFAPGVNGNVAALAKINENIQRDLGTPMADWNRRPGNGRTLVIQPVVEQMSFKHGAQRVLLGPLAGSSGVLMRMTIKDNEGRMIANPEFFQRAGAMAAGWAFGVHDNLMLTRVANLSTNYVKANFTKAVGGPTGADDPAMTP
jgi:hypothetical protein